MQSGKPHGFIYIGLLIGLAIVGIGLGNVSVDWAQASQRDREEELMFIGDQFRQAITRYYLQSPPADRRFPMHLEDMLEDARTPGKVNHYLRTVYRDPMTGTKNWGEVRLAGGQLVGVYSMSTERPIREKGFALRNKDFIDKSQYAEWVFRSPLPAANPLLKPDAAYSTSGNNVPPPAPNPNRVERPQSATPPGVILPTPRSR